MTPVLISVAGLLALVGGVATYGARVAAGTNPRRPRLVGAGLVVGVALAIFGAVWAVRRGDTIAAAGSITATTMLSAVVVLLIHALRRVPTGTIRVRVGERLPSFSVLTADGEPFASESLHGERILLKFFRGEWCPFCQAELKRFDAMAPMLARGGVRVIAISKDAPEDARRHRARDGLRLSLLCDPKLEAIRRLGLLHRKALEISSGPRIRLFGQAVGSRPAFRDMAAPTTFLVDERGTIRWIDQTDDYKVRSHPTRVFEAIEAAFGPVARGEALQPGSATPPDLACADCPG